MMGKSRHDIEVLCKKYLDRSISEEEVEEMLDYFKHYGIPDTFDQVLREEFSKAVRNDAPKEIVNLTNRVKLNLTNHIAPKKKLVLYRWLPYVAAIFILGIAGLSWLMFTPKTTTNEHTVFQTDIAPGGSKATIVLADGSMINLDDHYDGIIMNGQDITYNDGTSHVLELNTSSSQLITLSTPRGGMYKVALSDGTIVWLNAESTLKYPTRFDKQERIVQLEGEAYFDVKQVADGSAGDHLQPFKVVSSNQSITVLGTEFNVSAYADEDETKTTLVEGKVRIASARNPKNMTLFPGEQGIIGQGGLEKNKVDVSDYIDWKNGEFVFRDETAEAVLHRIARWYDIDVDYSKYMPSDEVFSGSISRYSNLRTVLDIMQEAGGLAFEVKNRTVFVRNKLK